MERALNDARAKRCLFLEPASFTATSRVGANGAALDQVSWRFTSGGFPAESLKFERRRGRIRRRQESSAESGPTSLSLSVGATSPLPLWERVAPAAVRRLVRGLSPRPRDAGAE